MQEEDVVLDGEDVMLDGEEWQLVLDGQDGQELACCKKMMSYYLMTDAQEGKRMVDDSTSTA